MRGKELVVFCVFVVVLLVFGADLDLVLVSGNSARALETGAVEVRGPVVTIVGCVGEDVNSYVVSFCLGFADARGDMFFLRDQRTNATYYLVNDDGTMCGAADLVRAGWQNNPGDLFSFTGSVSFGVYEVGDKTGVGGFMMVKLRTVEASKMTKMG